MRKAFDLEPLERGFFFRGEIDALARKRRLGLRKIVLRGSKLGIRKARSSMHSYS